MVDLFNSPCHFWLDSLILTLIKYNHHMLLLFISINTWTSTLHLTSMRTLYSILAWCILPLTASYCKLHIGHLNSTFEYFCLCFGNHWLRVQMEGREMDLLPRLFQVQGLCLLWANMAAEFALDVIQETFRCLDSCQGGDYSRIFLWLQYLYHTLINSGELLLVLKRLSFINFLVNFLPSYYQLLFQSNTWF